MSEAKHTPGEWIVWDLAPDSDIQERQIITSEDGETEITGIIGKAEDAHLIAAAPDLLAALKSLRNEIVGQLGIAREEIRAAISTTNLHCVERRIEQADAAIAKAEGRAR